MPARSSQEDAIFVDPKALRDACISRDTRNKYTGSINGIKKWLRKERSALDPNIARYFTADGDLNLSEFTPAVFEDFLAYKRTRVKAVTLSGFRSAIKDLYRTKELSLPVEYGEGMKRIFSGIKRYEAETNQSGSTKNSGKGKIHRLRKDFDFPSIDSLGAWRLWWFGDIRRGYPPYQSIYSDDLDTPKKKATLSEWSMLMRHIVCGIEEKTGLPLPVIRDEAQAVELFNTGCQMLKLKPSKRKRRVTQIKLTTVLRLVREAESSRTRSLPFTPRKRQKPAND